MAASFVLAAMLIIMSSSSSSRLLCSSPIMAFALRNTVFSPSGKTKMIRKDRREMTMLLHANQQQEQQQQQDSDTPPLTLRRHHRILCYGDSLTAGVTNDGTNRYYPYGPYLERALQKLQQQPQSSAVVMVRSRGIPGWTADAMTQDLDGPNTGLRSALQALSVIEIPGSVSNENDDNKAQPLDDVADGVSLAIILAGTNDLGFGFGGAQEIAENIIQLHRLCLENNVPRTLAIAVPPSGYQSINQDAATLAQTINQKLQDYCDQEKRASYTAFPFEYTPGGEEWATDGLHFSQRGFQTLGESLAPVVASILQELDDNNHGQC